VPDLADCVVMLLPARGASTLIKVVQWLRDAVRDGDLSAQVDGNFPRYAWRRVEGQIYEARLSNSGLGQYKGYPIQDGEAPGWLS